jgi:hypothetical protein
MGVDQLAQRLEILFEAVEEVGVTRGDDGGTVGDDRLIGGRSIRRRCTGTQEPWRRGAPAPARSATVGNSASLATTRLGAREVEALRRRW